MFLGHVEYVHTWSGLSLVNEDLLDLLGEASGRSCLLSYNLPTQNMTGYYSTNCNIYHRVGRTWVVRPKFYTDRFLSTPIEFLKKPCDITKTRGSQKG